MDTETWIQYHFGHLLAHQRFYRLIISNRCWIQIRCEIQNFMRGRIVIFQKIVNVYETVLG